MARLGRLRFAAAFGLMASVALPAGGQELRGLDYIAESLDSACETEAFDEAAGELTDLGEMYRCLLSVDTALAIAARYADLDPPDEAAQSEIGSMICRVALARLSLGFDIQEKVAATGNPLLQAGCDAAFGGA